CLAHPVFSAGQAHTGFVAEHFATVPSAAAMPSVDTVAMAALVLLTEDGQAVLQPGLGSNIASPRIAVKAGDLHWEVRLSARHDGWLAEVQAQASDENAGAQDSTLFMRNIQRDSSFLQAEVDGVIKRAVVATKDDVVHLFLQGR